MGWLVVYYQLGKFILDTSRPNGSSCKTALTKILAKIWNFLFYAKKRLDKNSGQSKFHQYKLDFFLSWITKYQKEKD